MSSTKRTKTAKKHETVTTTTGPVSVVSEAKGLRISYNEADMPVVEFLGNPWTGKDIRLVVACIPRAYRLYKRDTRRQGVTK